MVETRRSRSRLQTKIDSDPRNRYTTASLVINHANAIDLAKKAFLQANQEHKQERDEHNLKLQINMRLMIMKRSSSLYSKGLIATGEQDQELGPWFTTSGLGGDSCSKTTSVSRGNQELNKTQTLRRVMAGIYRVLGITPLDAPPNGPKHDTWSNGPKDGVVAPWQIVDANLFRRFPLIPNSF